jgi:tetratricopeptide (TPR) repeat protein
MRSLIPALLLPVVCLSLQAETTGRITGKVLTKEGKPIPGAKITLKRLDRNWTKELIADKHGAFLQVGLDPVLYDVTISAEGFVSYLERAKIPLGDMYSKEYTLLTPGQAQSQAVADGTAPVVAVDPGAVADMAGREAFNKIIPLYNAQKYGEALPDAEKAYKNLLEARDKFKDEQAKADLLPEISKVERVYGICLALGSDDRKAEAEPFLTKALEANPKDERALAGLIEVAKAKQDKVAEQKYEALMDQLQGPNPDKIYNQAVEAFNAGHTKEAKAQIQKVMKVDAKYAEAYYLLAMVEFGEMNLKGTKANLEKYLELAPNGKNAATAKEMLKDPSLKHIK